MDAEVAARNALKCVLEAEKGESIVIFCDEEKMDVGKAFVGGAIALGLQTRLTPLEAHPETIRDQVPPKVVSILKQSSAIYINLMRGIREEAPFRIELINLETKERKARLGHCPGITLDMLTEGALALSEEEHERMQCFADDLVKKLKGAARIQITSPTGTKISLSIEGRSFFTDTIIDKQKMNWMNLPTGEVTVAPVENSAEGELICDLAAGGIGPIATPITFNVHKGKVQSYISKDPQTLNRIRDSLNTDKGSSTIGEFAIGINPKARLSDEFLELEKIFGTIHIAFGNNSDFPGGRNPSKNHLDLLVSKPTVKIFDKKGSSINVLKDGAFQS